MMLKLPWSSTTLSSSCNIAASSDISNPKALIKKQCRLFGAAASSSSLRLTISTGRQNDAVSCEAAEYSSGSSEKSVADRLWPGSLTEDGLSYKEKFIVRCYEVGINKTATVDSIANLLQEVTCNHVQSCGYSTDGFGTTTAMRKLHLIWVATRMHIEIYKYPARSDVVEIESWFESKGGIGIRRDWILKDHATHEVLGRATSKFVMINQDTRKLAKVSDDVQKEYLGFSPREPRLAFPEEKNGSLKKIAKLEDAAQYSRQGLVPRRAADLDMNQHVNNVAYIRWVLESMPQEIIDTHELETITIDYKKECKEDDEVDSHTSPEPYDGTAAKGKEDYCQFLHSLTLSGDGLEIGRCYTEWRKKPTRQANHSV
ncbi:oleoyl-acyl carrier protein thioesterase 1, chloroplastic-like [Rhododendron vialii]|uniref:oleoyl-acyl carrier protein thioesterase 1, chloroplastic-like n=1 Tax=Rhododendron vialii TaxID=182163 RepID=UPI00265DA22D|nr:oleoyl-acyl carrier protein thioesterase 1, chloroplastic-like [Rhododendron vialii]